MYDTTLNHVNTCSKPSELKITDLRVVDIDGAPKHCTLLKILTNQGIEGYGEVRDAASKTYALMLKSRLLGQNPCNIDKLFRRIKQFGGHSRQGGGVSGIEIALWDIAGKAYGVPVYQMLGGKFRDAIRMYCDTDVEGKHTGADMGRALQKRMQAGFTFLKMDLGIELLFDEPGALNAPLGFVEEMKSYKQSGIGHQKGSVDFKTLRNRAFDIFNIPHPFTGIHVTDQGFEILEQYLKEVRSVIGYEVPLAIDHFGHIGVDDCIKLARRVEPYNLAWMEDLIPWQLTQHYVKLANASTTPLCTGEDIYLKEGFKPLLESGALGVIHPDLMTCGGILEGKKIGDLAQEYGVAMAVHMAGSPVACMAAVHAMAATENVLALEFHSFDVPWWNDLVNGIANPLIDNGYITVPDAPGLGIESLNDELLAEHLHPDFPGLWEATDEWNAEWSNDRLWS